VWLDFLKAILRSHHLLLRKKITRDKNTKEPLIVLFVFCWCIILVALQVLGGQANTHSKITTHEKVLFVKQVLLIFSCVLLGGVEGERGIDTLHAKKGGPRDVDNKGGTMSLP
jgi:hypothetical protein